MGRCEGYYRTENRRCDRSATTRVDRPEGGRYDVCEYHRREGRTVVRWEGETDRRLPAPRLRRVA